MLAFLQALHPIAAKRGDGLRPELLRRQIDDVLNLNLPNSQPVLVGPVEEEGAKPMTAMHRARNERCVDDNPSIVEPNAPRNRRRPPHVGAFGDSS
ncbi:hypothetical protein [Mesorhizobium hawassense]|uniref:hypothetical protein n=1 Tax=Mesorhizobium hawassense TaxID=1209954 RepID=UPI0011BF0B72|nr:hypothetical protein [Mesorhizobium hawassense]